MTAFSLFATMASAAWLFPYDDFTADGWSGYCQDKISAQQSPVDLTGIEPGEGVVTFELEHQTDFQYFPRMHMMISGDGDNLSSLEVRIRLSPAVGTELESPWDLSPISEVYFVDDESDNIYTLGFIHVHFGMAEHSTGEDTDGSFHLIYKMPDKSKVVFEIPFKFSDTGADTPWSVHTKCANEYPEITTETAEDISTADDISDAGCGYSGTDLNFGGEYSSKGHEALISPGTNIFDLLVGQPVSFDEMIHYYGSSATPACTPNVKHVVHRGAPYEVKPFDGWEIIRDAFQNTNETTNGNFREPQPLLPSTKFYSVEDRTGIDPALPEGSNMQFATLAALALATIASLF